MARYLTVAAPLAQIIAIAFSPVLFAAIVKLLLEAMRSKTIFCWRS
jgi:hypothetical protein